MFTGIIQVLGRVEDISKIKGRGRAAQLTVDLGRSSHKVKVGDSVSINGACLTITKLNKKKAIFELISETVKKTSLGSLIPGEMVNIENSLKAGDTIDGHFVLGHVDGQGKIIDKVKQKDQMKIWISLNKELSKYMVPKGSVAIDGVSLTIIDSKHDSLSVALIPHTIAQTTLGSKKKGHHVNIEVDILGKYVRKILTKRN